MDSTDQACPATVSEVQTVRLARAEEVKMTQGYWIICRWCNGTGCSNCMEGKTLEYLSRDEAEQRYGIKFVEETDDKE